jgi:hypothetical protein
MELSIENMPIITWLIELIKAVSAEKFDTLTTTNTSTGYLINPELVKWADWMGYEYQALNAVAHDMGAGGALADSALRSAQASYKAVPLQVQIIGTFDNATNVIVDSNDGTPVVILNFHHTAEDGAGAFVYFPLHLTFFNDEDTSAVNKTFGITGSGVANEKVTTLSHWAVTT